MNTSTKRHALIAIAMLAAALAANQASAADVGEVKQAVVKYSDLDLSQQTDARRLYSRIKRAARKVCDDSPGYAPRLMMQYRACMTRAVNDAVDQVQSTRVAAIRRADVHLSMK